jgi:hypothetical protein
MRQLFYAPEVTHAKIMRREPTMRTLHELAKWPTLEEYVQCCLLCEYGRWIHVPINGATKRARSSKVSSMRFYTPQLWRRAIELTTPVMMKAQEREHGRRV